MRVFNWPERRADIIRHFKRSEQSDADAARAVDAILADVRENGDAAVARLTEKFDKVALKPSEFEVPRAELKAAWDGLPSKLRAALRVAARRIAAFHKRQRLKGWVMNDPAMGRMELRVQPLERVGVYAPGGKATYPSTVLMNVIPAKVAGVDEVILVTPPGKDGLPSAGVLAAAWLAKADRVLRIGGAQAMAALAYGTKTIPRVDKLVGPGNIFVATAKQRLFGQVDIDSVAGPTEVLVLADSSARLDWIAADLLAQAEHDQEASSGAVLIGGTKARAEALRGEVERQLGEMSRREIAAESIRRNGYIILCKNAAEAAEIANLRAPEHVEVITRDARKLAAKVRHAGAIFIGGHSPEPLGDYVAGPNHTLPTAGTARFFSPLSTWSFYKTCHTIEATPKGLARLAPSIHALAEAEGLEGHAKSVAIRKETRR